MKRNLLIRLTCLSIFTVWSMIGHSQVKTNGTILGKVTISEQGSVAFEPISKTPQAVKKPLDPQRFENLTSRVPGVVNKIQKVPSKKGEVRSKMSPGEEKQNVENLQLLYLNNSKQTFLSSEYELFAANNISLMRLYGEREYFISPTTNNIKQYKARIRAASSADSGKVKVQFHFVDVNLSPGVKELLKTINIYIPDFINDKVKLSLPDCDIQLLQQQNVPILIDHSYGKVRSLTNFGDQTLKTQYRATSTIWSEGFEGAFPGTGYVVGDAEPLSGLDYWDDISCDKHSGNWSIWCAAVGDQPDCVNYDDNMWNYVANNNAISVAGYSDVHFTFWTKYNTEVGYDDLTKWSSSDGINYTLSATYDGNSGGWIQKNFTLTGFSDYYWEFDFSSDGSNHGYVGAYLDDMEITSSCANLTKQAPDIITISGTTVSYDVTIINNGTGSAQASELGYYLSTSTAMTTNYLLGTDLVPALASNATSHQTFSVNVLSVTPVIPPGTYYASYIIDDLDQVPECDETDNMWVLYSPTVIVTAAYCSGTTTLTSSAGSFTDGSGSNDYNYNSDCKWLIQPTGATSVTLSFSAFNTESGYDFVTVYNGSTTSGTVLGTFSGTAIPANVTSTGGTMLVHFTSDNSVNAAGWAASYTSSTAPVITVAPTSLAFGNVQISTSSPPQTYTVSGSGLTANIVITAPTGYGVCLTSGGTYTGTLTLTQSGGSVASTTVYVKFSPTLVQAYNGNITNTSTGATTKNVALTGTGQNCTLPTTPTIGTITHPTCSVATGSVVVSSLPSPGTWTLTRFPGGITSTGTGTSTTVSGITPGTYYFTVTNSTPCTSASSANVVINAQPAVPTAPTVGTITQPTCTVATGSVVLSGLPATGTWTLTRTPGAVTSTGTGTSTTITGLAAGSYTYTVTNSVGCISVASSSVVIDAQPTTPSAPIVGTITHPTCTVATGSVVLSSLPATGTWTLTRTPGAITTTGTGTSATVSGIPAGTYTFTVTNASGCTSTASANVVINAQPAVPTAPTVGTITQPTCTLATGSVVLNGLPATGTWTLTRTPGTVTTTGTGTSTTITGLAAGTYTYTVTNTLGCTSVASANVVINAQPVTPTAPIVGTIVQPTCTEATGSVVIDGLPSSGTWTLTRVGGTTTTGTGTSTTLSALATGTYTFTVTSAAGCTSVISASAVIDAQPPTPAPPTVGTITHPTCTVSTGSVIINGLPVTGTWTLTRTPGGNTSTGIGTSSTISLLIAGTYTYKVTNSYGCISVASGNVIINAQPPTPTAPTGSVTQPKWSVTTGTANMAGLPATGIWTLTRSPGGTTNTGTGTTSPPISGIPPGTYTWTVTNSFGCTSVASSNLVIQSQPTTPLSLTASSCNDKVSLKWRKSGDVNFHRYRIYIGLTTNPTTKADSSSTAAADTSKVISGLIRGQTYFIRVTTVVYDVKGAESNFSNEVSVIVKTGVIPRVKPKWNSLLICSNVSDSIKSFQWYKNGNSISGATKQYYNTNRSAGVYTVETIDLNGCKNLSVDKTIAKSGTNTFSVYPNPASVSFALKLNDESGDKAVVSIINSEGIKVMEFQTENFNNELLKEVPVNSLDEGIYFVKVLLDNKATYYTKLIIIK